MRIMARQGVERVLYILIYFKVIAEVDLFIEMTDCNKIN
jgi:hypothetical protein